MPRGRVGAGAEAKLPQEPLVQLLTAPAPATPQLAPPDVCSEATSARPQRAPGMEEAPGLPSSLLHQGEGSNLPRDFPTSIRSSSSQLTTSPQHPHCDGG